MIIQAVEAIVSAIIIVFVLLDVFLTVLYARAKMGVISYRIAHLTWRFFMRASKFFGRQRCAALSFYGPSILVLFVVGWVLMLILGAVQTATRRVIHSRESANLRKLASEGALICSLSNTTSLVLDLLLRERQTTYFSRE